MNSIKKQKVKSKTLHAPIWEFYFQMVYVCPVSDLAFVLANTLEKFLILAPPLAFIFYDTDWSSLAQTAHYFILSSASAFNISCIAMFASLQVALIAGVYDFLQIRAQLAREDYRSQFSFVLHLYNTFLRLAAQVLVPISASFLSFSSRIVTDQSPFADYKHISQSLVVVDTSAYIILAFNAVSFVEVLALVVILSLFGQDRSLRGVTFWETNNWYGDVAKAIVCIVGQCKYVMVPASGSDVFSMALVILWVGYAAMLVWLVRWRTMWVGMGELFFGAIMAMLQAFIALCDVFKLASFEEHSQYVIIMPIYALIICAIRYYVGSGFMTARPKNEHEAIDLIEEFMALAQSQDRHSYAKLAAMLNIHSDACANSSCECRDLKMALWKGTDVLEFQTSTKAYITRYDRTDVWQKGCLNRVLRLILGELEPHFARSNQFCVMLAEIYFYYLANFYYAWEQISIVKQRKPSVMLQQRIYNLSRMIHSGMECDEDEDLERTTESIDYLKYYNNFLEQIEESTELTIKFWTILLDDRPSSQRLNELGKALFESKYLIMQIVQEISKITSNQVEFLVRYGLFMKYVMHDASSAEQAFKRIYHSQESSLLSFSHTRRFSIFRGDVGVMLVIGSLESSTNATICEINNETEKKLGYTREEMLGSPVTMLMSPIVSQCHERLVQTFFRTLNSNTFATAKIRFIKRSDGTYLACDSFKKVVPRLSDGLQVALFMIATPSISGYTCYKQDATKRKAGAVLCDSTYKITGLNREAMESLRIDETCVKDILRNTSALDAFPQLNDPAIMEAATRKEGVVIATPKFELQMERDEDLMILTKNEGATRLSSGEGTLTWIRMVHETYSETDKANVLIMAEVLQENRDKYTARKDLPGVYVNNSRRLPEIVREKVQVTASEATGDKGTNAENYQRLSDAGSMISVASVSVNGSSDTSNNRMMNISNELTMRNAVNKQTPASIVKLYAVIIALLVVIAILIVVNVVVAISATNQLTERFDLIKAYLMRYKVNMAIASAEKSYTTNLKKTQSVFDALLGRIAGRINIITNYNEQTRKLLFAQGLDYDMEEIAITDLNGNSWTVQFSHSILIYINAVNEFMSYGYYSQVSVCATNTALSMCQYINKMLDYSFQLAFTPMRNKEDEISTRLQKELNSLATDDETTQYVLVGVCIALVAISAGVITPIFIKVIRDKSYVFAIFSHIQPEEIRIVIKECKKLDVKRVRFKKAWVSEYADQQEVFWRKVRAGNRVSGALQLHNHGASRDSGLLADKSDAGKGMPSQGVGESDMGLVQTHQNNTKANGKSPAKKPPNKWEEDKEEDEEGSQGAEQRDKAEFDRAEKERKRVDLLSATDYDLRNKSILRLVFSFILFLAYGGISIYFNHYVHSVNSEAVSMFFVYHNRAIYAASAALFLKEAITTGNKVLVSKNSGTEPPAQLLGNDGKMYLMDVIDNLHTIEKEVSDFSKRASESIYGNFLALQRRAESSEFCAVSDSYNYSQTLRTNRIFTVLVACSDLYTGPGQQGVSAGMSYLIDFYTQYAVKVTNADYTNATVAATMKNDQNPTLFTNGVIVYLNPILEYLTVVFHSDAKAFFELAKKVVYTISFCFIGLFSAIYLFIFIRFVGLLNTEIRQTREIVNMIPMTIIENNNKVRDQVWNHKGIN